jgi:Na+/H+-dicarboxylate symporter
MKWYWIVLIVLGAVAIGMIVAKMIKPKANSLAVTATSTTPVVTPKSTPNTTLAPVIETVQNADTTRTISITKG